MPAFCHAISCNVFPSTATWSIPNAVIPVTTGFGTMFVLSYRPPTPTSKKDVPAFYARKRARSQAFGDDEEDELPEDHPPPAGATDQEKIEYRRRRNTLAARRSRQKKADKMATLEDDVRRLTSERDTWKTRAQTLRQLLLSHGIPCKEFED